MRFRTSKEAENIAPQYEKANALGFTHKDIYMIGMKSILNGVVSNPSSPQGFRCYYYMASKKIRLKKPRGGAKFRTIYIQSVERPTDPAHRLKWIVTYSQGTNEKYKALVNYDKIDQEIVEFFKHERGK
jgi:hypothetical protein